MDLNDMTVAEKNTVLQGLEGKHLRNLTPDEMKIFEEAVRQGCARRTVGFPCYATVKLTTVFKPMK